MSHVPKCSWRRVVGRKWRKARKNQGRVWTFELECGHVEERLNSRTAHGRTHKPVKQVNCAECEKLKQAVG